MEEIRDKRGKTLKEEERKWERGEWSGTSKEWWKCRDEREEKAVKRKLLKEREKGESGKLDIKSSSEDYIKVKVQRATDGGWKDHSRPNSLLSHLHPLCLSLPYPFFFCHICSLLFLISFCLCLLVSFYHPLFFSLFPFIPQSTASLLLIFSPLSSSSILSSSALSLYDPFPWPWPH